MARYKGYKCGNCTVRIYKGSLCRHCKKQSIEHRYGLSFSGHYARPSEKFWRAWRADADAIKRQGLKVEKDEDGWWVRKGVSRM